MSWLQVYAIYLSPLLALVAAATVCWWTEHQHRDVAGQTDDRSGPTEPSGSSGGRRRPTHRVAHP